MLGQRSCEMGGIDPLEGAEEELMQEGAESNTDINEKKVSPDIQRIATDIRKREGEKATKRG